MTNYNLVRNMYHFSCVIYDIIMRYNGAEWIIEIKLMVKNKRLSHTVVILGSTFADSMLLSHVVLHEI